MSQSNAFPTVTVIVLNHNGMTFLKDCFDSLLDSTYPDTELIMVDNGSDDGSVPFVEENYPTVTVIHSGGNIGYSAANNLGVRHARGEYVVLLNNDVEVVPGWLQPLVAELESDPEIAACQPKLLHMRMSDVMRREAAEVTQQAFPDSLRVGATELPLEYHFDPGHAADGITLVVPLPLVNQVSPDRGDWLVPGVLEERVTALLRSLPKQLRRSIVPIPDTARRLAEHATGHATGPGTGPGTGRRGRPDCRTDSNSNDNAHSKTKVESTLSILLHSDTHSLTNHAQPNLRHCRLQ